MVYSTAIWNFVFIVGVLTLSKHVAYYIYVITAVQIQIKKDKVVLISH